MKVVLEKFMAYWHKYLRTKSSYHFRRHKRWLCCPPYPQSGISSQYNVYAKEKIKVHDAELIEAVQEEMDTQVTARGMISEEKVISILIEKSKKLIKKLDEVQPE